MAKRHFLQQAHRHEDKHLIAGQYISEKLDGQRAFWDGGVTRGMNAVNIPWANTEKDKKIRVATGLWSRYGKPIHAPGWWLDQLPTFPLDGELWAGRGQFQKTRSIVSKHSPIDAEWAQVQYVVFDSPTLESVLYDSIIDWPQYKKDITGSLAFISNLGVPTKHHDLATYNEVFLFMQENVPQLLGSLQVHEQIRLHNNTEQAVRMQSNMLSQVLHLGGEGIVLRDPYAGYLPERCHTITKLKPYKSAEAMVTGYITGRQTDKGSKLRGLIGAIILNWNGKKFELSGFTQAERLLTDLDSEANGQQEAFDWAWNNPEVECPSNISAVHFPRGTYLTFKYRELTDAGIPKEASYFRKSI